MCVCAVFVLYLCIVKWYLIAKRKMYGKFFNRFSLRGNQHIIESRRWAKQKRPLLITRGASKRNGEDNWRWIKPRESGSCERLNLPPLSLDKNSLEMNISPKNNNQKSVNFCEKPILCEKKEDESKSKLQKVKN